MFKEISDAKMKAMAAEAARCLEPETYEKGKSLYNQGLVKWSKVFGPKIYAAVDDRKTYTVTININDFPQSTCTCAKKRLCEHIAALYCYYCDPRLRSEVLPTETFDEVLSMQAIDEVIPMASITYRKNTPRQKPTARDESPLPFPGVPGPEGPVKLWYDYFEYEHRRVRESKGGFFRAYSQYFEGELYFSARLYNDFAGALAVHSENWPSFNKALYLLHGSLFFMDRLERQKKDAKLSYLDSYQIEAIMDKFMEYFTSVLSEKPRDEYRPFLKKAVEVVREQLLQGKTPIFDWLFIYRFMCVTSFVSREWAGQEAAYLKDLAADPGQSRQVHYYAALGLASLKIAAGRSDAALAILQKLEERRLEDLLFYPEHFIRVKEWDNLLAWLRWLAPEISEAHPAVLEDICENCIEAAAKSSAGEDFIKLIRYWLPRSIEYYAAYLMEEGRYREWAELIMCYQGLTWENINKSALRHLESRDPEALMPLYHQWTARLIEEKNRKSYQAAVKLLKKLRAIYNRQKKAKEWHIFISRLASHYSRLRAFQEELQKGKLIS